MIMSERTLTERRKADRAMMAGTVAELARQHGLTVTVTGEQHGTRETSVALAGPHGLKVTMRFQGNSPQSRPDTYVLSWYGVEDGWRLNPTAFAGVNPYHGHKAIDVVRSFRNLVELLARRFACIADGSAFIPAARITMKCSIHGNHVQGETYCPGVDPAGWLTAAGITPEEAG